MKLAVSISKRSVNRFLTEEERLSGIRRIPKSELNERIKKSKGSQPPISYKLVHTSPAYRTKSGRIKHSIDTWKISGTDQRVRLFRPWRNRSDPPLEERPMISEARGKKMQTRKYLHAVNVKGAKLNKFDKYFENVKKGTKGPGADFFRDK